MKKKEIRLYVEQLIETGKGLALASFLPDGSKEKEAALKCLNESKESILSQLELLCEDCDYKKIEEVLTYGEEAKSRVN